MMDFDIFILQNICYNTINETGPEVYGLYNPVVRDFRSGFR